ncbi:hypothetical protein LTR17_000739 [Elasticomyces elasticus]|nr:hypothetical protein LTR17_000739 [Elasticomyces elasticus]
MAPTTVPAPAGCGTKRSFSGTPLIGNSRMATLYKPTLVSIFVCEHDEDDEDDGDDGDDEQQEFQVPRGLICASSEYFDKAFGETFEEGKTGKITLPDANFWVFECFVGWLYTQQVFWEHQDSRSWEQPSLDRSYISANPVSYSLDVADLVDPVTWEFEHLFALYIFADKYDTRRLRSAVMEHIQTKLFQTIPVRYVPIFVDCIVVFNNLPGSSPLYKLIVDLVAYELLPLDPREREHYERLPLSVSGDILGRLAQLARCLSCDECREDEHCEDESHPDIKSSEAVYKKEFCKYHEHESNEERELCVRKWGQIRTERGIKV